MTCDFCRNRILSGQLYDVLTTRPPQVGEAVSYHLNCHERYWLWRRRQDSHALWCHVDECTNGPRHPFPQMKVEAWST